MSSTNRNRAENSEEAPLEVFVRVPTWRERSMSTTEPVRFEVVVPVPMERAFEIGRTVAQALETPPTEEP